MNELQKFKNILEVLEVETQSFKDMSKTYQKLQELAQALTLVSKNFSEFKGATIDLKDSLGEINTLIEKNFIKSRGDVRALFKEIEKTVQTSIGDIEGNVETLKKDNKNYYKELEGTITLKLNDNKSEIKQLIEYERGQMKDIIQSLINKQTDTLLEKQKNIGVIIWIFGSISVILGVLAVIRLFTNFSF